MSFRSRVIILPLAIDLSLFSDSNSTWKLLDLDVPELEGLLSHAESIQIEWLLDQVANGELEWNLDVYVGWDRNHENAVFTAFGTAPSAAGSQLAAADGWATTNYRRHARLVLKWRLKSPTSTPKAGVLSAVMHVTTKGT